MGGGGWGDSGGWGGGGGDSHNEVWAHKGPERADHVVLALKVLLAAVSVERMVPQSPFILFPFIDLLYT